jgi:YVTN family beta-propeller protein
MGRGGNVLRRAISLALVLLTGSLALSLPVAADGGAPNLAYVAGAGTGGGDVAVIDIGRRSVTAHIAVGGDPAGVVLSADGATAYVTREGENRVAVLDTRDRHVAATVPAGPGPTALAVVLVQNRTELYVADSGGNTVTVLDADARRVLSTIRVGTHPSGVAVAGPDSGISNPDDAEVYVTNSGDDSVSVLSATRRRVEATIPLPAAPLSVVVPATGGVAYVTTATGAVLGLSLADHRLLGAVLRQPHGQLGTMDYDAATGQVYVPDAASGAVDVLAPVSAGGVDASPTIPREPARTIKLGGAPAAVAITFEGSFGFVAERSAGRVAMLDVGTHRMLATVDVGGAPTAVVTGPYPPAVSGQTAFVVDVAVVAVMLAMMTSIIVSAGRGAARRRKAPRRATAE